MKWDKMAEIVIEIKFFIGTKRKDCKDLLSEY
jgi:hypothetical protein